MYVLNITFSLTIEIFLTLSIFLLRLSGGMTFHSRILSLLLATKLQSRLNYGIKNVSLTKLYGKKASFLK